MKPGYQLNLLVNSAHVKDLLTSVRFLYFCFLPQSIYADLKIFLPQQAELTADFFAELCLVFALCCSVK